MKKISVEKAKQFILNVIDINGLESKIKANQLTLSNQKWASTGSEYHIKVRKELEEKNAKFKETLEFLKTP